MGIFCILEAASASLTSLSETRSCHVKLSNPTAPSLNDWSTAEFQLLQTLVFELFAMLLNRVEHEGKWPPNIPFATAVFLYEEDPENAGPLDLRTLLILLTTYRRWASTRLRHLEPRIER